MSKGDQMTGRLIAAARILTGVSPADLAKAANMTPAALAQMEAGGSAIARPADTADAVRRALEDFGAQFMPEGDGMGAGVRLRFTRQDVKQIGRLEGEGGIVREDDVP
jgi:transcriptional regulator with XRE-family HTH domain